MSTPTITRARPIRNTHLAVAADLLAQYAHLPMPTSVTVSTKDGIDVAVELTVDTVSQVDAWAEEMRVEVEHDRHRDGTWTDQAAGMLAVVTRSPYTHEHVVVHVYAPQTDGLLPHQDIDAKGAPQPCTHLALCAADEAEFTGHDDVYGVTF